MNPEGQKFDPRLERAMEEIRRDTVDEAAVEEAAARVWARLAAETRPAAVERIRTCADFQSLFGDYRAGRLPEARTLLLKDHLHECVACRRALDVAQGKVVLFPATAVAPRRSLMTRPVFRWAAAAVVVLGAGMGAWKMAGRFGAVNVRPTVQAVNGTLYEVTGQGLQALPAGSDLPDGAEIRTAKDSHAVVQLRDGSIVEVRERSAFTVAGGGADLTVKLARGSVIVQAAKRRAGHLYVATADCRVAVTGTVFSVSAGLKGSRVSVIEGQVRVAQNGKEKDLQAGEQLTTNAVLEAIPVRDEIAWSRNRERFVAALAEVAALRKRLDQVRMPELRYSSRLMSTLPANVVVYASVPNLGAYLTETENVLHQRLAQSPALRAWWSGRGSHNQAVWTKLRMASQYLGDEILIVAVSTPEGGLAAPVFLAEARGTELADFLRREGVPVKTASQASQPPEKGGDALYLLTHSGVAALSVQPAAIRQVMGQPAGGFAATPLGRRVAEAYTNGAGLLVCADLEHISGAAGAGLRYFMAEQRQLPEKTEMRAALAFTGARPGMAAWLAAPAPMGALDYVSPEATVVTAIAMASPAKILNDSLGKGVGPIPPLEGDEFGIQEIAASLGGEFAVAVDGPALPTPWWKLVVEVYDPGRLQQAIDTLAGAVNARYGKNGKPALRTARETVNGRTYYTIGAAEPNPLTEAHYTFSDGYLIMGASRAVVDRALQYRGTGYTLVRSPEFAALVPRDHHMNFSGLLYYNLAPAVAQYGSVLDMLANEEQRKRIHEMSTTKPTLVTVYGEPDRIAVAGSGSLFNLSIANLLTGNAFGQGLPFGAFPRGTRGPRAAYR